MSLTRGSGVALWRQIQQMLQRQIAEETFRPGDRLPTEFELAAQLGVNRHTVRRALGELEEKGLIRVEQGRGTFVREQVIDYKVGRRTRFTENLARQNRTPSGTLVDSGTTIADRDVTAALEIAARRPVVYLEIVGEAEGRPISVSLSYHPLPRFSGIEDAVASEGTLTKALKRYEVDDYLRRSTRVIARLPTGREADLLQQPRNRPVLASESIDIDVDGIPIAFVVTRFNADWVQIIFEP